jgi:hypothetical protein
MKKIKLLCAAAMLLVLGLCGCASDDVVSTGNASKTYTFIGSMVPSTRMGYHDNGNNSGYFTWQTNDKITVWSADGSRRKELTLSSGANTENAGVFTGELDFAPKYITFKQNGTTWAASGTETIVADTIAHAVNHPVPVIATAEVSSSEINESQHTYSFILKHKVAYVKYSVSVAEGVLFYGMLFFNGTGLKATTVDYKGNVTPGTEVG